MNRPLLADLYRRENARMAGEKAERRELVLAYPDLAARLTKLPWPYSQPAQWTGHIPPYLYGGRRNDSPQRADLVAICREAISRKWGEEIGTQWVDAINHDTDEPQWTAHTAIEGN